MHSVQERSPSLLSPLSVPALPPSLSHGIPALIAIFTETMLANIAKVRTWPHPTLLEAVQPARTFAPRKITSISALHLPIKICRSFHDSKRNFAARSSRYKPKYQEIEEKNEIVPSRFLDPIKERKLPPVRRQELAFDEKELGNMAFEAFDVSLESRELDPEEMSDTELETLVLKQQAREDRILRFLSDPSSPKSSSNTSKPTKTRRNIVASLVPTQKPASESSQSESAMPPSNAGILSTESSPTKGVLDRKPLVAIVGRPNVGKSTLFNRLIRKSRSLITNTAGTTRDRKYGFTMWEDYELMFVDTGGMLGEGDPWAESITEQALLAIEESDVIVMLTDFVDGVTETDRTLARMLRKTSKPTFLVVNKCDNESRLESSILLTFQQLGLGPAYPISASHGYGTEELLDAVVAPMKNLGFKTATRDDDENAPTFAISEDKLVTSGAFNADGSRKEIRVALVGVPNVGKSSLLNQILGSKRSVVSDIPGTTTDPIDQKLMWKNSYPITIVDTAGVRRKKSQEGHVERLSALWSLKVIESSHVSILLLDAVDGAQAQDVKLSSYIIDNYRSCIVVVNKWDLAPDRSIMGMQAYEEQLRERLQFWYYVPVVFASAKTGFNVDSIMAWVVRVSDERRIHLATRKLFQILEQASIVKLPPASGRRRLKFKFCTQVNLGGSPTFIFFVTYPELIDAPYKRFLEGFIRQNYAFTGTPIRLMFRKNTSRSIADRDKRKQSSTHNPGKENGVVKNQKDKSRPDESVKAHPRKDKKTDRKSS